MENDSDEALLAAVKAGSNAAFGKLVDRHQQAIRAFVRRLGHSHADADDVAQETFVTAWTRASSFRGGSSVRTWLCGIAWRKAKSAQRSWFRSMARDKTWQEQGEMETLIDASNEESMTLKAALDGLPLEQRAALALCLGGDFSHGEAAEALGLPLGTVKSHVARGRTKLQQMMGDQR